MFRLHYDVDAGKQLNIGYKGVEFEIQAGEGEGGGSDVVIENNRLVTLTTNGTHVVYPSIDNDAMAKVTATVNVPVPPEVNVQDWKYYEVTRSGSQDVTPDSGYDAMQFVQLDVSIPTPDIESNKTVTITTNGTHEITPSIDKDAMAKVTATVNVPTPPISNAVWYSTVYPKTISAVPNAIYVYTGSSAAEITISADATYFTEGSSMSVIGDNVTCSLAPIHYYGGFGFMSLPNVILAGGYYYEFPLYGLLVTGSCNMIANATFGSTDPNMPCTFSFYGSFGANGHTIKLRNCDLYFYTNNITRAVDVRNYSSTEGGRIHVLTTFTQNAIGGHTVIKDLTPP